MSPEQTVGKPLDRRTDVFALGTSLWELAVDRRLFKGKDDTDTLRRVHAAKVSDPRSLVDGFPDGFAEVLLKSLSRERESRYATAADFSEALFRYVRSVDGGADQGMVSDIMRALFAEELRRHQSWIEDASAPVPTPRMDPLRAPESTMAAIDEMPIVPPPVAPSLERTLPLPGAVPRGAMPRAVEPANPPQKQADPAPSAPSANEPRAVPVKSASAAGKAGSPVVLVILMLIALALGSVAFYLYQSKRVR
jgi:serine/threonine-protein kinase